MNDVLAQQVRSLVLTKLKQPLLAKGLQPENVPDDFDLLTEGVIDSQGLIELILALEQRFDFEIDFEQLDPEQLMVIGPFCHYIAEKSVSAKGRQSAL
jgi:acyl carrier protein